MTSVYMKYAAVHALCMGDAVGQEIDDMSSATTRLTKSRRRMWMLAIPERVFNSKALLPSGRDGCSSSAAANGRLLASTPTCCPKTCNTATACFSPVTRYQAETSLILPHISKSTAQSLLIVRKASVLLQRLRRTDYHIWPCLR